MVIPDLTNPVLAPIVRGIQDTLWTEGLGCLLADTDNRSDREEALVAELTARRCEGLIVATSARTSAAVTSLLDSDVPTVLVTREPDDHDLPFVSGDDRAGVKMAVDHLLDLGHRSIAYLTGPVNLATTLRRVESFREATANLSQEPVIVHGDGFTVEAGLKVARQFLDSPVSVSAILAGNDMMALGVLQALDESCVHCPADVSVVGYNDMPFMGYISPPLTTVRIPQYQVGVEAARMLLDCLAGRRPAPYRRLLETELVVRASSGPPKDTISRPQTSRSSPG